LGVPNLLPGWLSVAAERGGLRLVPLDGSGQPVGAIVMAPELGAGQLIAANPQTLLMAHPAGRAVELEVVRCDRKPMADPTAAENAAREGAGGVEPTAPPTESDE
jgi:hypothetical protein